MYVDPYDRLLDLNEVRYRLGGIARSTVYELRNNGDLSFVKVGQRSFIRESELNAYIAGLTA